MRRFTGIQGRRAYYFLLGTITGRNLKSFTFQVVWLRVYGGAQPPVLLEATSPFVHSENKVEMSDTARANLFKIRLANAFLLDEAIDTNKAASDLIESWKTNPDGALKDELQEFLLDFIDFLTKRGV